MAGILFSLLPSQKHTHTQTHAQAHIQLTRKSLILIVQCESIIFKTLKAGFPYKF